MTGICCPKGSAEGAACSAAARSSVGRHHISPRRADDWHRTYHVPPLCTVGICERELQFVRHLDFRRGKDGKSDTTGHV